MPLAGSRQTGVARAPSAPGRPCRQEWSAAAAGPALPLVRLPDEWGRRRRYDNNDGAWLSTDRGVSAAKRPVPTLQHRPRSIGPARCTSPRTQNGTLRSQSAHCGRGLRQYNSYCVGYTALHPEICVICRPPSAVRTHSAYTAHRPRSAFSVV